MNTDLEVQFESFVSCPYQDVTGVWTIGYGSIRVNGTSSDRITSTTPCIDEPTAKTWLQNELLQIATEIKQDVKVTLTDNELAALEDWIYNLGIGNFLSSTLLRKLNQGDHFGAAAEFEKWDHAGGIELRGLLRRRAAELLLFVS